MPHDYGELSEGAQRQARLAILADQTTPERLVRAWDLFRKLYLRTTPDGFFYDAFNPSPPFHYELVGDVGRYARNAFAAPRGFAKSTVIGTELILLLALTRPYFKIALGLATDKLIEARFDKLMTQFIENPFILNDFGEQKPAKGHGIWNRHHLHMINGTEIQGFSVTGRKRGARPHLFILDDPESDPDSDSETSAMVLIDKFERLLFRQIIPMLRKGSAITWIGTVINAKCFLHYACYNDEDTRFRAWNRKVFTAGLSEGKALWAEEWSLEDLEARKEEIGSAAFAAEYENKPATEQDRLLTVNPERNEYVLAEDAVKDPDVPLSDEEGMIIWHEKNTEGLWEKKTASRKELFGKMFKIITFDYASGLSQHHDYSCALVLGFDRKNTLWVLDGWMGRGKRPTLLTNIYRLGAKWLTKVIGIEAIGLQIELVDAMEEYLEKANQDPERWHPKVMPVKYPVNTTKANRIAGLEWRFSTGRVKYPRHLANDWPFRQLYAQTESFTYDLALLRFDDAIDTLAMSQYVVHAKGVTIPEPLREMSLSDRIRQNKPLVAGVPLISGLGSEDLKGEVLQAIVDKSHENSYNERNTRYSRHSRVRKVVQKRRTTNVRKPNHSISK